MEPEVPGLLVTLGAAPVVVETLGAVVVVAAVKEVVIGLLVVPVVEAGILVVLATGADVGAGTLDVPATTAHMLAASGRTSPRHGIRIS